ncbi:methyl-accepting chemotaxis protein [Actinoplanes sp. SE50]|uniref:methyl-accepting chemotaxis protein n=1 Tax=unclassified Actinoplanes TaxID=2626549 RepID=UPI00023ED5C6|nr:MULTISPECIES: methyl-accepting chemotaxis protein [unclassified Actinoplanes]AEV83931.1 Methyl-accepting chemotaxis protein III [Actinoplanes sp. SE50/110]ATO81925.1 methyl-accepting chemotaxis protein [Actinoplanes sp. SE50]SLL99333.1 methyl-accepting chemotaxis protein [Actinoplanes sp. SE50/110]
MKIMFAVLVVALLSVTDGLFAMDSLGTTNNMVKAGYQNSLELETIGNLRSAVNRTWLAASDDLLASDATARQAATGAPTDAQNQVDQYAQGYQGYPTGSDEGAALQAFRMAWASYADVLSGTLLPLAAAGDRAKIDAVRTRQIVPLMTEVRGQLARLSDLTVAETAAQETAAESRYQGTRWRVLLMLTFSAGIGVVLALGASRMIVRPLSRCVTVLDRIRTGDLTARAEVTGRDEVGRMADALNHTAQAMSDMVGRVRTSADVLASAAEELSTVSSELSVSAEETSAQVGTVSASAGRVSEGVQAVSAGAEEMGVSIREIANSANEAAGVAAEAARTAEHTNTSVSRLGEASAQISTVVALITSIAEQTNLLALNATIEAARAGEMGKGFAVVAAEVKDLAQETARATQEITAQVAAIQTESDGAVHAIRQIAAVIATINDYATTIAAAVEEQTATTAEIARSVGQAAEGSSAIAGTIAGVAQAAQQVTSGATETQQTAAELARTAAELQATAATYRT